MNPKQPYKPISCDFYDELEAYAVQQKIVLVEFETPKGQMRQCEVRIVNLETRNKEEFVLLDNGLEIRLDFIHSVDDKLMPDHC
jgi:Rho-binding antiterminator